MKKLAALARVLAMTLAQWAGDAAGAQTCTASTSPTNFGVYNPFDSVALDSTGAIEVTCIANLLLDLFASYTIELNAGSNGDHAARSMSNGPNRLAYNLYTDSSHSTVWGNSAAGSAVVGQFNLVLLIASRRSHSVYGRIPAGQNVPPGSYTDTIVVTVDY